MTVEDAVLEKLRTLPPSRKQEVLDFAEFLEGKMPKLKPKKPRKARIIEDPVLGLPVLDVGEDAPILTSEMVREMLADFP